jgi:hypothetical protein
MDRLVIARKALNRLLYSTIPLTAMATSSEENAINPLLQNREQNLRPHRDLLALRQQFADYILTLPDEPDTPPFTIKDFDALARLKQSAESIMQFEQRVGRRVRKYDG